MPKYYSKDLPDSPCYVNGHPLRFDILETSDPQLIRELDKCIAKQIGGVISLSEEQYQEELKKKANGISSGFNSKSPQGRRELSALHVPRVAVDGAKSSAGVFAGPQKDRQTTLPTSGRSMPDPIEVPSPSSFTGVFLKKPPTAKVSEVKG